MGHSITTYKDKNIISKDYKVEVWLRFVCMELETKSDIPLWLKEAKEYWINHINNFVNGCIDPKFEEFLSTQERIMYFIQICTKVHEHIKSFGCEIPKEYLNNLCNYSKPFEIREDNSIEIYLKYSESVIRLLMDEQADKTIFVEKVGKFFLYEGNLRL